MSKKWSASMSHKALLHHMMNGEKRMKLWGLDTIFPIDWDKHGTVSQGANLVATEVVITHVGPVTSCKIFKKLLTKQPIILKK